MKKKFLSMTLALAMMSAMTVPAFAADGDEVNAPVGTEAGEGVVVSSGSATITSEDGIAFSVENDDDALAKANDTTGADIDVWAKVIDASTPVYKIDLTWGAMKFEYNSGAGSWNTTTHTYDGADTSAAAWTVDNYLDGTNNKVTVTNHSNKAVDAGFVFAMTETNQFNDSNSNSSVVGNFFADNDKAKTAALVLTDTTNVTDKLADSKVALHTADTYYASAEDKTGTSLTAAGARANDVFFAFSGTPDARKGATLDTFKKVGVITVTVSPITDVTGFEF